MSDTRIQKIIAVTKNSNIEDIARVVADQIFLADNHDEAVDILNTAEPDIMLQEYNSQMEFGLNSQEFLNRITREIPVIAVNTGQDSGQLESRSLDINFHDHLHIQDGSERLKQIIRAMHDKIESEVQSAVLNNELFVNHTASSIGMAGTSKAAQKTSRMIELVAKSNCNPILVVGETGTGKELVAKSLHNIRHSNQRFVALNCAALTANLLESELFGHVKGAFTGADRDKTGLLESAESGTVFLDEISEMPLELQAKLLRVLQEKTFRKVGGTDDIICRATIIASSNRNLKKEVTENRFRRDLYYRLNICPITIPPLRSLDRKDDIKILTDYFLRTSEICPIKSGQSLSITSMAMESLCQYPWPGNVRELKNVIERAILIETTDQIGLSSIIFDPDDIHDLSEEPKQNQLHSFSLEKAERELISRALKETDWQKTRAASLLGITRATLYAKIKQYDIRQSGTESTCLEEELAAVD